MGLLFPQDKDTIRNMVQCAIEELAVPSVKDEAGRISRGKEA
jgi:hypothetical protein